jgi:hypothetical protein
VTGSGERLIIHPFARLLERKVEVCDRRNSSVGFLGNARVVTQPLLPPRRARINSAAQEFEASRTGTRLERERTTSTPRLTLAQLFAAEGLDQADALVDVIFQSPDVVG